MIYGSEKTILDGFSINNRRYATGDNFDSSFDTTGIKMTRSDFSMVRGAENNKDNTGGAILSLSSSLEINNCKTSGVYILLHVISDDPLSNMNMMNYGDTKIYNTIIHPSVIRVSQGRNEPQLPPQTLDIDSCQIKCTIETMGHEPIKINMVNSIFKGKMLIGENHQILMGNSILWSRFNVGGSTSPTVSRLSRYPENHLFYNCILPAHKTYPLKVLVGLMVNGYRPN